MKITLLNVKYSQNLGDGIIAECFEHALRQAPGVTQVQSCDLAGRVQFDGKGNQVRQTTRQLLDRLPRSIRRTLSIAILKQMVSTKLRAHYARELADTDMAVIGGGQLIADAELNFPLKVFEATQAARDNGASIAVYGVGVGHSFSRRGHKLFRAAFGEHPVSVHVRDERSAKRWIERFGGASVGHVWDPGLLSREVYGRPLRPRALKKRIGIGVTHPATLDLHADRKSDRMSHKDWLSFYQQLIDYFIARNWTVELFTNGACSDQGFARKIYQRAPATVGLTLADKPKTPKALAHRISSYDTLIAHRLHASVVAYSYGIPHVGLGWDSKMEGFFEATEREKFLISSPCLSTIDHVGQTAIEAAATPIRRDQIARVEDEVRQQISDFGKDLSHHSLQQTEKLRAVSGQAAARRGLTDAQAY